MTCSAERAALAALLIALAAPARAEAPAAAGAAALAPLTAQPGDPARGRALVADRRASLCLLCHAAPVGDPRFQGDLAPDLAGVGARLSEAGIRLRVADARRLNDETIMPPYLSGEGGARVAPAFRGRGVLDAAQIEDIVAWLATLK